MIQKLLKILSITILFSNVSFAQKEANIWYFGQNAGLDFNSGSPVALTNGQLVTLEGCASIADSNGNLQFYTDGTTIWTKDHSIMSNGTGLNGNFSSTQSAIIIPKPDALNIYYVFTVDFQGEPNGLQYSEVDMTLNSGLGAVTTTKNTLLLTPVLEKLTAVNHANGKDIWVICHKNGSAEFYAYLVTPTGVQNTPVITDIGFSYSGSSFDDNAGYMKVSPDGTKIAMAFYKFSNGIQLFDFNNSTGELSSHINFYEVTGVVQPYGLEFSPSGDILYVSGSSGISQFDITLPTVFETLLNTTFLNNEIIDNNWGALQLAPDGKIYVTRAATNGAPEINALSVINNPDVLGLGCGFQLDVISLGTGIAKSGLPPFIQSFFIVGFEFENVCFGGTTQFNANISQAYDSLSWDFGDGNSSNIETPTHTYLSTGDYDVTLSVTSGGQTSTETQTITIYEQPTATQPQDILVCDVDNDGFYSFDLTTQNTAILNGQSSSDFDITYYASMLDYTNGNTIVSPSNYTNSNAYSSQAIIASVFNVNNNSCEAITSFNIEVFESPTPNQNVPKLSFCDDTSFGTDDDGRIIFDLTQNETSILNGQSPLDFTVNYYRDSGLTNVISTASAYQNLNVQEIIYVDVVNNSNTNCRAQTSFDIEVFELPTVSSLVELKQCDDDLDGSSVFNLTEVNIKLSTNYQNETITFYESQADAENSNDPITNNTTYVNETVSTDSVWARVENSNNCYRTAQVNLIISTTQIPNTYTRNFYQCDDGIDITDGIATFDLSIVDNEIQALFPIGQQLIIKYYRNQVDALSEINSIDNITSYQNIGYPNIQNVFIRVDSAVDNDCLGLGHHITLHVETVPVANPVIVTEQCDDDGDGMYAFNTSNIEATLLNGQTNLTVAYFDGMGNSISSPLPNPFLTATQTITARVINSSSQDIVGACYHETQIVFAVDAAAVAYPISDFVECDDDGDGEFEFDTSNIETTVLNGQTGMLVSYFDEKGNLLPSPLPNPFTTNTQTITTRVENKLSSICYDETSINFVVSEQPIANTIANDFACDDATNDGEYIFILSNYDSQILSGQSSSIFEVAYFKNEADAQNNLDALPNLYAVNTVSQKVYGRVQNIRNASCYEIISFELGVHYLPIANSPENILVCDDDTNDGVETFDFSALDEVILNGQSPTKNIISYHLSLTDAETGNDKQNISFTNTESPQTIYVRLENANFPDCYTTTSFQIIVNEQPVLLMKGQWPICEGDTVEIVADVGYDEYLWSTGETSRNITVDTPGTYEVTTINVYGGLRCQTSKTITVTESNIATITSIDTEDWTSKNNNITVYVEGNGNYEYSLDGINYQDSNEFNNLIIDEYIVYVRDKNGCGVVSDSVYLLNYPKFFTPNNDGYNDTWQILNSRHEPNNKVYIYNRYGKLLKQLTPTDLGWDGTINGSRLISDDYWFVLERQNGKTYKGHFTLKR
ncbi:T9SS type B sorting domain-containing protein [Algibacter sp. TI.3.09]|uniref:T9SS type B sorting domain-containing protein n=1 Tax=Algibacter sp. TI.3.09 TaxID=3121298 RepID=UPI00311F47BA